MLVFELFYCKSNLRVVCVPKDPPPHTPHHEGRGEKKKSERAKCSKPAWLTRPPTPWYNFVPSKIYTKLDFIIKSTFPICSSISIYNFTTSSTFSINLSNQQLPLLFYLSTFLFSSNGKYSDYSMLPTQHQIIIIIITSEAHILGRHIKIHQGKTHSWWDHVWVPWQDGLPCRFILHRAPYSCFGHRWWACPWSNLLCSPHWSICLWHPFGLYPCCFRVMP